MCEGLEQELHVRHGRPNLRHAGGLSMQPHDCMPTICGRWGGGNWVGPAPLTPQIV